MHSNVADEHEWGPRRGPGPGPDDPRLVEGDGEREQDKDAAHEPRYVVRLRVAGPIVYSHTTRVTCSLDVRL